MHQARLKRCNQQLKVPVNYYCSCIFSCHERTDRTKDRHADRQTAQTSRLCGARSGSPNYCITKIATYACTIAKANTNISTTSYVVVTGNYIILSIVGINKTF